MGQALILLAPSFLLLKLPSTSSPMTPKRRLNALSSLPPSPPPLPTPYEEMTMPPPPCQVPSTAAMVPPRARAAPPSAAVVPPRPPWAAMFQRERIQERQRIPGITLAKAGPRGSDARTPCLRGEGLTRHGDSRVPLVAEPRHPCLFPRKERVAVG